MSASPTDPQKQFYEELGRALSAWAKIEEALADLYANAVAPENPEAALSSFWSIVSFEAKQALCDAAMKVALRDAPTRLSNWTDFSKRLKSNTQTRNKLAHGTVVTISWSTKKSVKTDTFLAIKYHAKRLDRKLNKSQGRKHDPRPKEEERRSLSQIKAASQDFRLLAEELWEFSDELCQIVSEQQRHERAHTIRPRPIRLKVQYTPNPKGT